MRIVVAEEMGMEATARLLEKKLFEEEESRAVETVREVVRGVRARGDAAVIEYTKRYDGVDLKAEEMMVRDEEFVEAEENVSEEIVKSLQRAAENIRRFHEEQVPRSWITYREGGSILGQAMVALERVGVYVPGGTASYPSSVLMNAIPARVAGVREIIMSTPTKSGKVNPNVLVAARLAGVDKIYKVGGAQAIAAMAFGTETIPHVNKITGPGNIFVTLAKKEVYGHCDIDMLAGPSEIMIVADETANPKYTAADMLSQAEHDRLASSIVITTEKSLAEEVAGEVEAQIKKLPRREIAEESIRRNGLIIVARDIDEAIELANISAPEHLELLVREPFSVLPRIRNAGAVFLGQYSPEPLGDYLAGPNHVLPTGGTAKFYSVLNVETFMRKMSLISYTRGALKGAAEDIKRLAQAEGLEAHAAAIRMREN